MTILSEATRKKPGGKPPISRHPLFPVTVALWFGALFGLGSMAIRPSLIEQAVLAIGLPAIIPAAEPPLGATTQLLLALTMAGMGGVLGALLARRLGRPKAPKRQRRRDRAAVASGAREADGFGRRGADEIDEAETGPNSFSRRRQLAIEEDASRADYHDYAPLPGGSPQILDVTEFDLDGFEADRPEPVQEFQPEEVEYRSDERQDGLGTLASEELEAPESAQIFAASAPDADSSFATVHGDAVERDETDDQPGENDCASELADPVEDLSDDPFAGEPAQIFGYSPNFARDGDGEETEADVETSQGAEFDWSGEDLEGDCAEALPFAAPAIQPIFARPADEFLAASDDVTDGPGDEAPSCADAQAAIASAPDETGRPRLATSRIMAASLGELSPAELLERLAMTLERTRNCQADAVAAPLDAAQVEPETSAGDDVFDRDAPRFAAPGVAAGAFQAPVEDAASAGAEEETAQEYPGHRLVQPPVPIIPAGLRPIAFDEDCDADLLPSVVPPRQFSMARQVDDIEEEPKAQAFEPECREQPFLTPDEAAATADAEADADAAEDSDEERDLEAGYSSLLSLSRSDRQQFLRIEDPEDGEGEVKPFVVFPGERTAHQGPFARPVPGSSAQPEAASGEGAVPEHLREGEERRFDQPGDPGEGRTTGGSQDPEETERSLKAALATLQRMSGAA